MTTQITSFKVTEKTSVLSGDYPNISYLVVNLTWKVPRDSPYLHEFFDGTQDILQQLSIENPEAWSDTSLLKDVNFVRVWVPNEEKWKYIQKFDTFWYKGYVSDCPVVRTVLRELEHFQRSGEFSSEYRTFDEIVLYKLLSVLCTFCD